MPKVMSLVEFMMWFYNSQDKQWLVSELIKHEITGKGDKWFNNYWTTLAEECEVELVNV